MPRSVIALRILWGVLMAVLLALIVTNSISGLGTALYSLVVMAVMAAEMYLRSRLRPAGLRPAGRRAAR